MINRSCRSLSASVAMDLTKTHPSITIIPEIIVVDLRPSSHLRRSSALLRRSSALLRSKTQSHLMDPSPFDDRRKIFSIDDEEDDDPFGDDLPAAVGLLLRRRPRPLPRRPRHYSRRRLPPPPRSVRPPSLAVIGMPPMMVERYFAGTPYVPVYVMLPLGVINMKCELVDPDGLTKQLRTLKSVNVDGVMVDCWWGIVEANAPQEYNWHGYKQLFQIVRELKLKLQVVMSFHECGGNVGDDVCIHLPHWVAEIGRSNPDIFFTDREGRRNMECLSWGIDKERVLRGRTAVEAYFDYMRSFRVEFDEFFEDGIISEIGVGLGPCGELRYPSYPEKHGWRYPGIGEFQCYDKYLMKSLKKAADVRGHSFWGRGPENAGSYNSPPHDTAFFCDGGDYDSYYGRFFLGWYSLLLIDHADRVLSLAKLAFEGTYISAKISGIHWWYKTASHAAELSAGFYNSCNRDGYALIASMLKKHDAALNFTCVELRTLDQYEDFPEAMADPEGLVWQVLNAAWDVGIAVASENALPCYDRNGYNKILENAKPANDPDGRHLSAFTYLRLSPVLMETHNFLEFECFVKQMHGEGVLDLIM